MEQTTSANMFDNVAGKAIIITGGTTGIGRATALLLAERGAKVFINGRHSPELEDTLIDAGKRGLEGKIQGIVADLARKDGIDQLFRAADEWFSGELDILINNAAIAFDGIEKGEYSDWKYVTDINVLGYLACCRAAIERMKEKGGHIVNIGSISADKRDAESSVYVATKAAIQGFSQSLRKEVNPMRIKVTLIEPGLVGTDMTEVPPAEQREQEEQLKMLKAEDIAACVLYTLSQPQRCDVISVQIRPHLQEF